jgi:hypothetical protein
MNIFFLIFIPCAKASFERLHDLYLRNSVDTISQFYLETDVLIRKEKTPNLQHVSRFK